MDETVAIHIDRVEQKRPNFKLGPITLEIPKGFITAIVGPNGSGKSSLFRLALDLAKPDNGSISLLGHPVGQGSDTELKQRIGYLSEESAPQDNGWKASDKASFHQHWYKDWDVNRYQELLHVLQVNDHQRLGKMSKGMRRKFEFALTLAHSPELLMLDEPSSGLDPLAWKTMIDILHRYMERGDRTLLMTSHIVEEVKRLADYIVFMAQGRVLGMYEKDELFSNWSTLFVAGDGLTAAQAAKLPGQVGIEHAGGTTYRVITNKALEADRWCAEKQLQIVSRHALELDEIMYALLMQDGISAKVYESKGARI